MHGLLRWGLLSGWILSAWPATAADTHSNWSVHVWQSDDGLPNNNVTDLAQTADGYLWVATLSRPARFDGVRFEEFSPKDFVDGPNQKVTALLSVSNGLWMAMDHGPAVFVSSKTVRVFTNGLPDKVADSLTEGPEDSIWISYRGGAVFRIRDGQVNEFTVADGLPGGYGSSLARDRAGRLWYARNGFIGIFRDGRFVKLLQLSKSTARLAPASGGGVWICSALQLMKCDETGRLQNFGAFKSEHVDSEPTVLLEDSHGRIWIGTSDSGLFCFNGTSFESVPTSHRAISSLLEDNEGNLWAGTDGGGLNRLHPRAVTLESKETGLPFETVQSVCEDTNGVVWATTLNGLLVRRRGSEWITLSTEPDWPGGRATCVTADRTGAVWIGTKDRALHCWRDGKFSSWRLTEGLSSHTIHTVVADATGDIWLGEEAPDVVQRLRAGKLETFPMPPGIRMIRAMTEDAAGNIWIGSSRGFLLRITCGEVTDETPHIGGGTLMSIRSLHATPDGSLWIGYADEGLGWFKDGRFAHIGAGQGLGEDKISQLISDGQGWLWFGGDHGIFRVRERELLDVAAGGSNQVRSVRYGPSEGLRSLQANFGDSPGTLRSRDGRLWMPARTALAVVNPDRLREDANPPRVLLKRVNVDDQTVARYGGTVPVDNAVDLHKPEVSLQLPPDYRRLQLEFTALNFSAPENVRFRYRLEGFDEHWSEAGVQRAASYSRLPAGDYRFRVKACNGDGIWNEMGATLAFTVAPFFWQTWWFRLGGFVLAVALVRYASFRHFRLKLQMLEQQAALEKERVRIAKDLHDDLGTRLTKVVLLSGLAQRDGALPGAANEHLRRISSMARQVIKSLDETVWAVNPRNDTLPHLINYIGQFTVDFLQTAEIRCRTDLPERPPNRMVPAKARHNLFLAVKEALNNIARHSNATEVRLRIAAGDYSLNIALEDNGQGFGQLLESERSNGLGNMRQRMEEIGGQFQIESKPGAGTRIVLDCPWRNVK